MGKPTGRYIRSTVSGEEVRAFVPDPLPPNGPFSQPEIVQLLSAADRAVSELRMASQLIPNADLFGYAFVRKEAIFSSQIEGIQATLSDLLNYEAAPEEFDASQDVVEVCNYLEALRYGRKQLSSPKGLPLSLRLIRQIHKRLMRGVRGASKSPGEFRRTQNWIGGDRPGNAPFVPPPPVDLVTCLGDLEKFLHESNSPLHTILRIGLVHVQFETIHPFLDGNGRLGRLLIALLFESWCNLDGRMLYLSVYFKRNQQEYYRRLDLVRKEGDWEGWSRFFLQGICDTAQEAAKLAQDIFRLVAKDRKRLLSSQGAIVSAIRLFEALPNHPIVTVGKVVSLLDTTKPTAGKAVQMLVDLGLLYETTGAKRNRLFGYKSYLRILQNNEG